MPRRGDNIRHRKDGRWEARYPKGYCGDCSGGYGSVYGRTYKEAKEKREQAIRQRIPKKAPEREKIFADILYAWQDANKVRLKEASISRYQNLIDTHILPELGNLKISQLTTPLINRFLSRKISDGRIDGNGGLSPSYVRSITLVIGAAIDYGVIERLCEPLNSPITRPPIPKRELSVLSHENQTILEQELLVDMNEDKLMILITLYSGLRIGEVCALSWEDINTAARVITVRQTISRVWYSENGRKRSRLIAESPKTMSSMRQIPICSKLYSIKHLDAVCKFIFDVLADTAAAVGIALELSKDNALDFKLRVKMPLDCSHQLFYLVKTFYTKGANLHRKDYRIGGSKGIDCKKISACMAVDEDVVIFIFDVL